MTTFISIKNPKVDEDDKKLYEATDRDICIALASMGHTVVKVLLDNRRVRYQFFFDEIEKDLALLASGELMVNAKAYASESAHFKTMMNV